MADKEPKGTTEQHAKAAAPPTPDEPKGPFDLLFSGADGPIRALVLDVLLPNSTRQYTLEELENNTRVPVTRLKEALPVLVDLRIVGAEGDYRNGGRVGYNSGNLGYPLTEFYSRWRAEKETAG